MRKDIGKSEKGQGLVEFALVLPILLLILVAVVDFGWFIFVKTNLNNAAREGARVYAVKDAQAEAYSAAESYLGFMNGNYNIGFSKTGGGKNQAGICTVNATVDPLIGLIYSGPMYIESSARMRLEYTYK